MLKEGTLQCFIDFVNQYKNCEERPVIYFSNGVLKLKSEIAYLTSFDAFVRELAYWSSWSTGMAFWKSDFDSIPDIENANYLFPHTKILFALRKRTKYIIDDRKLLDEIPVGNIPKGRYNLFDAFAVEYPSLLLELERAGDISKETFLYVKDKNFEFISDLYFDYIVRKMKCSYDLSDYRNSLNCYYSVARIRLSVIQTFFRKCGHKVQRIMEGKK